MTALPTSAGFTEATVTEAQFKNRMSELRDYLAGLFGVAGTVDVALASLGALAAAVAEKTAAYTVVATDRGKVLSCSGAWTLALPAVAIVGAGFSCVVVNRGSGTVTIDPDGTELINGVATMALLPGHGGLLICTGAGWISVGVFGNETVAHADGTAAAPSIGFGQDSDTGLFRTAANSLGLTTGGVQRARVHNGGLEVTGAMTGTAVTQSATDSTAGRLMKVGDFGLGGNAPALPGDDLNSTFQNGTYGITSSTLNAPGSAANGVVQVICRSILASASPSQFHLVMRNRSGGGVSMWVRNVTGSVFGSWQEVYNQSGLLGAVSQAAGRPTGAVIERGSNANGEYVRFADGTQICRVRMAGQPTNTAIGAVFRSNDINWTYPAAFGAEPSLVASVAGASNLWANARASTTGNTTTAIARMFNFQTDANAWDISIMAIGRWF